MLGVLLQYVEHLAKASVGGHHHLFPQWIDGGIGHLRKALTEKVTKGAQCITKAGWRRVVPHGAGRLFAPLHHRLDHHLDHLVADLVVALKGGELFADGDRGDKLGVDKLLQIVHFVIEPVGVGLRLFEVGVDLFVFKHRAKLQIHCDHLAALQPATLFDILGLKIEYAILARDQDPIVIGEDIFGRAQSVSVQHTADVTTIGHAHRRRAVPRLVIGGAVLIKGPQLWIHVRRILPGRRNQPAGGFKKVHAVDQHKLQHIIQTRTIAHAILQNRHQPIHLLLAKDRTFEHRAFNGDIVAVSLDRVDLTVVSQCAKGLCQTPPRQGVGRKTLMKECKGGGKILIGQIGIELFDMGGHHQSLIADGAAAKGGDIEIIHLFKVVFELFARQVEQLLKPLGRNQRSGHDKGLHDKRQRFQRQLAERVGIDGHLTEKEHPQIVSCTKLRDRLLLLLLGEKKHPHRKAIGQIHAGFGRHLFHKIFGHPKEQAASVATLAIGGDCAPVDHAAECRDRIFGDLVRGGVAGAGQQAKTAVIFFES